MPGKTTEEEVAVTEVKIGERKFVLKPLVGLRSIIIVPKITTVLAKLAYAALQADIDIRGIFSGEEFNWEALKIDNLLLVPYVSEELTEQWPTISMEIMPVLLSAPQDYLLNNGEAHEHFTAWWTALKYHAPSVFGEPVWEALKKYLSAEAEAEQETMDSESSET